MAKPNGTKMMHAAIKPCVLAAALVGAMAGCEGRTGDSNQIMDGGLDGGELKDGLANLWVSPDGCQYWYIDDGIEGFMAPRLHRDGTPVCNDQAAKRGQLLAKDGTIIAIEPEPRREVSQERQRSR